MKLPFAEMHIYIYICIYIYIIYIYIIYIYIYIIFSPVGFKGTFFLPGVGTKWKERNGQLFARTQIVRYFEPSHARDRLTAPTLGVLRGKTLLSPYLCLFDRDMIVAENSVVDTMNTMLLTCNHCCISYVYIYIYLFILSLNLYVVVGKTLKSGWFDTSPYVTDVQRVPTCKIIPAHPHRHGTWKTIVFLGFCVLFQAPHFSILTKHGHFSQNFQ